MTLNVATNVRLGRVRIYVAPTGTADPVMTAMPTGAWNYIGWMMNAVPLLGTVGTLDLTVDDLITPVDTVLNSRAVGLQGEMAEFLLANLQRAWGGTLTSTAATTGVAGYDKLEIKGDDDVPRFAIFAEQTDPREVAAGTSLPVGRLRLFYPYALMRPNGNSNLSRKGAAGIPFQIEGRPALDGSNVLSRCYLVTAPGV